MNKRFFINSLSLFLLLFVTSSFASFEMATKNFKNSSTLEAPDELIITATESFDNTYGYLHAPSIKITAPSIKGPRDSKLGRICWTKTFLLNDVVVPKSYAKCK